MGNFHVCSFNFFFFFPSPLQSVFLSYMSIAILCRELPGALLGLGGPQHCGAVEYPWYAHV